jgi:class 3 adenylate cyclase
VSEHLDDLVAAGLYDPDDPLADDRLELFVFLLDEVGASIPELVQADEQGGLYSFAAFRSLRVGRDGLTFNEAVEQAGIDPGAALTLWRSAGFADPRPFERRFGRQDVEMFELFGVLSQFLAEEQVRQLIRILGEAVGRVAEAEVSLLRSNIEAPLAEKRKYVDVARTYVAVAEAVLPRITDMIDSIHRHHLQAIGRRYSEVGARSTALNMVQLAIGFADLAGYTGLWQEHEPALLAEMLDRFEAITGDVITTAGANVAKRIGDAVMFVTNAPGVACALALELLEACTRARLPKLRVGVSFGYVMVRHGDFYGPTVNLASRLVSSAEAGTALTDAGLQRRLERVRGGYVFFPAGRYQLAGFEEPVVAYQLLRP